MGAAYLGERHFSDNNPRPSQGSLRDPLSLKCELENVKLERLRGVVMELQSKRFCLIHQKPRR